MKKEHVILHVDDDVDDLEMLQLAFELLGEPCKLLQQRSGPACLKILENWSAGKELPCLIVLDINMPEMDGKETFTAIRSNPRLSHIPIIIFSSSSNVKDRHFFKGEKVQYLVKPFTIESLTEAAAHMLTVCDAHDKAA